MGCASSTEEPVSVLSGGVRDLGEVRQLISTSVKDEEQRRKLLRLAGAAPQVWTGCSQQDVVGVLVDELAEREREESAQKAAMKVTATPQPVYSIPPAQQPVQPVQPAAEPPVQVVHVAAQPRTVYIQEPAFVQRGPRLGSAILTGVVAGRVAGRTAARRRRF